MSRPIDQPRASSLAREGFDLWQAGRLEDAVLKYEEANRLADPNHWALHAYHGEFACVLEKLGRLGEAEEQLRLATEVSIRQDGLESDIAPTEAYFYADFLLRHQRAEEALKVVAPWEGKNRSASWLIPYLKARAYSTIGRNDLARASALTAIGLTGNEEKRTELANEFKTLLGSG